MKQGGEFFFIENWPRTPITPMEIVRQKIESHTHTVEFHSLPLLCCVTYFFPITFLHWPHRPGRYSRRVLIHQAYACGNLNLFLFPNT